MEKWFGRVVCGNPVVWTEVRGFVPHRVRGHLVAALEGVLTVAPRTAQIAAREAHKYARQSRVGGLPLQRLVDFGDLHGAVASGQCSVTRKQRLAVVRDDQV